MHTQRDNKAGARRRQRGFTMLEFTVTMGISSAVVLGIFNVMAAQNTGNKFTQDVSEAQANARVAVEEISRHVALGGFGIPGDFTVGQVLDNVPAGDMYTTCPGTDVLTVRYRDIRGYWSLTAGSPSGLSVAPNPAAIRDLDWELGSWLLVYAAFGKFAMVKTTQLRDAPEYPTPPVPSSVTLDPALSAGLVGSVAAANATVQLVRSEQFRLTCVDPEHPTLVVAHDYDFNRDGVVNQLDVEPLASDIEDLQFAYFYDLLDTSGVARPDGVIDVRPDTDGDGLPDSDVLPTSVDRIQALKGVRISLVARSARVVQDSDQVSVSSPLTLENHVQPVAPNNPPFVAVHRYARRVLRNTVVLINRDTEKPTTFSFISNKFL